MNAEMVFREAQQASNLDHPNHTQTQVSKVGSMNGRILSAIVLGSASVLFLITTVVAAVFSYYIVAAICGSVAVVLALTALLSSRISTSKDMLTLLQDLSKKASNFFKEKEDLKKQNPVAIDPPSLDKINERKEELKQQEKETKSPQKQIDAPSNKCSEEIVHLKAETQKTKKKIEDVEEKLKKLKEETQKLKKIQGEIEKEKNEFNDLKDQLEVCEKKIQTFKEILPADAQRSEIVAEAAKGLKNKINQLLEEKKPLKKKKQKKFEGNIKPLAAVLAKI